MFRGTRLFLQLGSFEVLRGSPLASNVYRCYDYISMVCSLWFFPKSLDPACGEGVQAALGCNLGQESVE